MIATCVATFIMDTPKPQPLFMAVGYSGQRLSSTDGLTWSRPQLGKEGEVFRAVCFGKGRFVAVGNYGGRHLTAATTDGENWKFEQRDGRGGEHVRGVCFGNDLFVLGGGDPPFTLTSTDGITWSEPNKPDSKGFAQVRRVAFGDGRFVAVGDHGWRGTSRDGANWTRAENIKAVDSLIEVAFGNGLFVGVGLHGLRMVSADGVKWTDRVVGEEGEHLNSILWTGERFVAVGIGATYFSPDGLKWDRQPNKNAPLAVAYGNGVFVGCHWKGRLFRSKDGVEWQQVLKCEQHLEAVGFGG